MTYRVELIFIFPLYKKERRFFLNILLAIKNHVIKYYSSKRIWTVERTDY